MKHLASLKSFFQNQGFNAPDIALLQPADPFLDTAGEDMRRRIFMTQDRGGSHLCLRPEFTIPICLAHLASDNTQGRYTYSGNVFRQRRDGAAEFIQAGIETIGGNQTIEHDVACITTAIDALTHCGVGKMQVVVGDKECFEALLDAMQLPAPWRARLARAFGDGQKLEDDLQLITNQSDQSPTLDKPLQILLDAQDHQGVEVWISAKIKTANLPITNGRTASEIAARMIAKWQLAATRLSAAQQEILREFLSLEVPLNNAAKTLQAFANSAGLDLSNATKKFEQRAHMLTENYGDDVTFTWRAGFGRRLDYYTGIVFEISQETSDEPLCGGGRYDRLINMLGAQKPVPAIGFSIWLDRLGKDTGDDQ